LGLSICRKVADLLGGTLQVASQIGAGSTFRFTVKFELHKKVEQKRLLLAGADRLRTLVVDDNPTGLAILQELLTSWKMPVDAVSSGLQAMDLLKRARRNGSPYHLGVIDGGMPEMDGFSLAAWICASKISQASISL
jgi:two-component system sensor histidine kinase/response regulator